MALTPGSTSNSGTTALYNKASGSWNHTTQAGENSLWVHVGVHNTTVTGITFNSDAMTQAIVTTNGTYSSYWYYIVNPDIGTYAIEVTYADTGFGAGGAIAFSGTDTSDPLGVTGGATGSSTNPAKTVTTETDNSIVLQGIYGSGEGSANAAAPGANETEIYEVSTANLAIKQASRKTTTTAGNYSMSETLDVLCNWSISVVEVKTSSAAEFTSLSITATIPSFTATFKRAFTAAFTPISISSVIGSFLASFETWGFKTKHSSSYTQKTKNTSSYTQKNKNESSWSYKDKN